MLKHLPGDADDPFAKDYYPTDLDDGITVTKNDKGDIIFGVTCTVDVIISAEILKENSMTRGADMIDLFEERVAIDWFEVRRVLIKKLDDVIGNVPQGFKNDGNQDNQDGKTVDDCKARFDSKEIFGGFRNNTAQDIEP